MARKKTSIVLSQIESKVLLIRGLKVLLDSDLAQLYGVETKRLKEQVKRNIERFPEDFIFTLDNHEVTNLRSQFATSSFDDSHGGRRYSPMAFTEHGALMAATVLNSRQAVEVSVFVVRAFVKMREFSHAQQEIDKKLDDLERRMDGQDEAIVALVKTLRQLTAPPVLPKKRPIGFAPWEE